MLFFSVDSNQFLPYFPPHKWGLETVAEEFSSFYVSKWYWEVVNVVFSVWQETPPVFSKLPPHSRGIEGEVLIKNNSWKIIWYVKNWYKVYLLPAFDIIPNFPVPKFWKREFWEILKNINTSLNSNLNNTSLAIPLNLREWNKDEKIIIQTHTRFFLSSFIGWLFAKYHKLKWIHIEHWSDYVKL